MNTTPPASADNPSAIANRQSAITPPTYPARPVNGGPLTPENVRPGWLYEPKYNGWRALVHVPTGAMFNRQGERLSIKQEFSRALDKLRLAVCHLPYQWLDCEALDRRHAIGRGALIVLDVVPFDRLPQLQGGPSYWDRIETLRQCFWTLRVDQKPDPDAVYCPVPVSDTNAVETYGQLERQNNIWGAPFYEGMVAKKNVFYPMQLRSPDQEFPFWQKHRWAF